MIFVLFLPMTVHPTKTTMEASVDSNVDESQTTMHSQFMNSRKVVPRNAIP